MSGLIDLDRKLVQSGITEIMALYYDDCFLFVSLFMQN